MNISRSRILIISPYFYPNIEWGGPVTVSWNLAKLLTNNGHRVEVITTDVSQKNVRSVSGVVDGIKITYAKSLLPGLSWKYRIFLSIDQIVKGVKLIPKFDVVHFNDIFILQNFVLSIYCRKYKVPYIITPHGNLSFDPARSKSWLKRLFYFLFGKSFLEGASKIIAVSDMEKGYIDNKFSSLSAKTIYIPNAVLREKFNSIDIRSKYRISQSDKIILFIGRIYSLKGVKELLLGFSDYLNKISKPATLVIAGPDAGGLNEIKQLLKHKNKLGEKVILAGEVKGDLKYSLFLESGVICLLSKSETIPVSLVEAASFGKPIICSKECNLQSLVDYGGAVLSSREPSDISKNLEKILGSEKVMIKMGNKSKEWFKKNYDSGMILKKYKEIYDNA